MTACRNVGVHPCGRCRTTFYCSKTCQTKHSKTHKLTCNKPETFPPLRPGVFDFMRLPCEVRDKIYAEVIVARFPASEQSEYNELSTLEDQSDRCNRRRDRLDSLKRDLMVSPGFSLYNICKVPTRGARLLANARGLFLANKQISQELKDTHWSKNTFRIRIQEDHPYNPSGRPYREYITLLAQRARRLYLEVVTTIHQPGESGFQACVDAINCQLHDIVTSLNRYGTRLDSLSVCYMSCFPGEIEDLRIDADGLAAHEQARIIRVLNSCTDKVRSLNHTEIKQLYLHNTTIADALCALNILVPKFRIVGDLSGTDLSRISRKFNLPIPHVDEKLDNYGQRISDRAEDYRDMVKKHPESAEDWMEMAIKHDQIFSDRASIFHTIDMYGPASTAGWDRPSALIESTSLD